MFGENGQKKRGGALKKNVTFSTILSIFMIKYANIVDAKNDFGAHT